LNKGEVSNPLEKDRKGRKKKREKTELKRGKGGGHHQGRVARGIKSTEKGRGRE